MEDRTVVKVKIAEAVKGGVVTSLEEVRALIPHPSCLTEYVEKLEDWQASMWRPSSSRLIREKKRLVLSGREVEKEKRKRRRRSAWLSSRPVMVEGTVDSIKPYGAFIKLDDGVDGLLHISQISTQRIKHPSAVLTEDRP